MLLAPLRDLGEVLVLLPDVILLGKIDQIDDGLGAEQEERVDDLDLLTLSASVIRNERQKRINVSEAYQTYFYLSMRSSVNW